MGRSLDPPDPPQSAYVVRRDHHGPFGGRVHHSPQSEPPHPHVQVAAYSAPGRSTCPGAGCGKKGRFLVDVPDPRRQCPPRVKGTALHSDTRENTNITNKTPQTTGWFPRAAALLAVIGALLLTAGNAPTPDAQKGNARPIDFGANEADPTRVLNRETTACRSRRRTRTGSTRRR